MKTDLTKAELQRWLLYKGGRHAYELYGKTRDELIKMCKSKPSKKLNLRGLPKLILKSI